MVAAYHKGVGIPWHMRIRWFNCKQFCDITSNCVHIHREGNLVVDALAKNAQNLSSLLRSDSLGLHVTRLTML